MASWLKAAVFVGALKLAKDVYDSYVEDRSTETVHPTVTAPSRRGAHHPNSPRSASTSYMPTLDAVPQLQRITDREKKEIYGDHPVDGERIRVVLLATSYSNSNRIECQITTRRITDRYETLSWVWHEDGNKNFEDIVVNDKLWSVPSNLVAALKVLRADPDHSSYRALWIDALCLDQDSDEDKKHGIPRMREIYSQAQQVILWLGEPMTRSTEVFTFFNSLPEDISNDIKFLSETFENNKLEWTEFWNELRLRKFWTRLWIVQEVASASSATVYCGSNCMSWALFHRIAKIVRFLVFGENPILHQYDGLSFYHIALLKEQLADGAELDLVRLISSFRGFDTTLPEDRIYALLGLTKERHNPVFLQDYRSGYVEIWTAATEEIVQRSGKLDFITLRQSRKRNSALPSWVPDLSLQWTAQTQDLKLNFGPNPQYNAANGKLFAGRAQILDGTRSLRARGCVVDVVSSVSDFFPSVSQNEDEIIDFKDLCCRMALGGPTFPDRYKKYPFTNEKNERALSRTLVCDVENESGKRCQPDYGFFEGERPVPENFFPNLSTDIRQIKWRGEHITAKIQYLYNRRFIMSKQGYMGLVPENTEVDDVIAILYGATAPILLRPTSTSQTRWTVIGASYVHGIMDGEAVRKWLRKDRDFDLI